MRGTKVKAQWTPRPKWAGIRQLTFNGNLDYYENHAGLVDSRTQNVYGNMSRQDTSSLFIGTTREFDNLTVPFATAGTTLPVGTYQWQYATIGYNSDRTKRVYGSVGTDLGGYYSGDRQTSAPASTCRSARRCCSSRTTRTTACRCRAAALFQ